MQLSAAGLTFYWMQGVKLLKTTLRHRYGEYFLGKFSLTPKIKSKIGQKIFQLAATGDKNEILSIRTSHWRCSIKKAVLKNLSRFTGKHLFEFLFNKVAGLQVCSFIKKNPTHVLPYEYCEIFRNIYFKERLLLSSNIFYLKC